jgi:alginate O-acetyltransferase complex protein AlgJ
VTHRHTPNREEQALREVGHTAVSPSVALLLAVLLLFSLASLPALQSLAELRGATDDAAAQQPLARLAPQLRALAGKLPGIQQLLAAQGFLAANRELLAAIDDFESRLEEESILRSWLLPRVQGLLVAWLGQGNEQAYVGLDGWLFYRADVDYVVGAGFLEPEVLRRRSLSGEAWEEAPQPDPVVALVDLARQLRARDIQLLVVPTPAKPMVHPERFARAFDGPATILQNPSFQSFKERLRFGQPATPSRRRATIPAHRYPLDAGGHGASRGRAHRVDSSGPARNC